MRSVKEAKVAQGVLTWFSWRAINWSRLQRPCWIMQGDSIDDIGDVDALDASLQQRIAILRCRVEVPVIAVEKLSFSFPDSWQVTKYDDWEFYRKHFTKQGDGIKAVDLLAILIAIPNGIDAFLIEAKDYRHPDAVSVLPSKLADDVAKKVRDTLAAMLPARLNAQVEAEQSFANSVLSCRTLTMILHVEQKSDAIDLADLKQKLRGKLRAIDANPKIVSKLQMQNLAWKVA